MIFWEINVKITFYVIVFRKTDVAIAFFVMIFKSLWKADDFLRLWISRWLKTVMEGPK